MDYSKGLKRLRASADAFDYDRYVKDAGAGKFDKKTKSAKEIGQEGLMRRKAEALDVPEMDPAMSPLSEQYIRIRNRRKGGGFSSGVEEALEEAMEYKEEKKEGEGLMRPKARPPMRPESRSWQDSDSFIDKLIESESSGRTDAEFTAKGGRRFVGQGQFGEARLADFKKYTNTEFTQEDFKKDPTLQDEVMKWHVRDLDKQISKTKGAEDFDRDGLRAVAHLGGVSGMKQFVASGGKYNPSDELGTSLMKYYRKFSS
jgi:hypothetical protein